MYDEATEFYAVDKFARRTFLNARDTREAIKLVDENYYLRTTTKTIIRVVTDVANNYEQPGAE